MAEYQGPRALMERLFLLYLAGRCCENLQSARSPAQCKSGPGNNMVSRRDQLLLNVSLTIHLHLVGFTRQNAFEKKTSPGNAHWTNYWIWIEGGLAPWPYVCPTTGYFHDKTKISKENLRMDLLFTAKILLEAMYLTFLTWTKSLTKFNPKMQNFKRVLDLNCK